MKYVELDEDDGEESEEDNEEPEEDEDDAAMEFDDAQPVAHAEVKQEVAEPKSGDDNESGSDGGVPAVEVERSPMRAVRIIVQNLVLGF